MRIRIIDDEKLLSDGTYCDMLVCAFAHKTVYYKKELSGETEHLKTLAKITENADNTLVCPFDTNNYGIIKKSAGVF
ncbi:MAG: hypothetical protein IJS67_03655, partial [Clostridia bacterium]|nr:hypothetical protein [Clostridia bacterium]